MCFRVAVAELENWLLADRVGFAGYFGVREGQIPDASDSIDDPKALLLRLAISSRRREVRDDRTHRSSRPADASRSLRRHSRQVSE